MLGANPVPCGLDAHLHRFGLRAYGGSEPATAGHRAGVFVLN